MTTHAQTATILSALAADLDPILASGRTARITLNIGSGGNVRAAVATCRDIPADIDVEAQRRKRHAAKREKGDREPGAQPGCVAAAWPVVVN